MEMIIIYLVVVAAIYAAFFYFKKRQTNLTDQVDFKAELNNAERYKSDILNSELHFLKKQMGGAPIDAFNYADIEYSGKDAMKDGMKDSLKSLATLGMVRFQTVNTPKYLVLSGINLHLFDTDDDGNISNHLIFGSERLQNSTLQELPMTGKVKGHAQWKGKNVKGYKLSLKTDGGTIDLIIFSCLIFANIPQFSLNAKKNIRDIVIGNDFLKILGEKHPNLSVPLPILN